MTEATERRNFVKWAGKVWGQKIKFHQEPSEGTYYPTSTTGNPPQVTLDLQWQGWQARAKQVSK